MSTADQWDFTVPDGDAELLAELRRRGVAPGRRLHVWVVPEEMSGSDYEHVPRHLSFAGSIHAEPDLSERGAVNNRKRKSVRGVLVGKVPAEELLTREDFETAHRASIVVAERRHRPIDQ